ncbi:hypothetical protein DD238_003404 [Peronospora effusa]|uniref:Reverse transcriptase Ty1/copia-type domain-containing protein n=1 Tax=Peronospora effusa TaxID=542832 RepID=A0A3M6VH83_9STRA|nr:hypothetical protein DD238_003404 [Peronospora effusa]
MKSVSKFEQNGAYALRNPICAGQDLTPDESHLVIKDITLYRNLVGSLLYILNATRSEISYVMSVLSQYLGQPLACGFTRFTLSHGSQSHELTYKNSDDKNIML